MSTTRIDYGVKFDISAGTTKIFQFTVIDPETGQAKDLSDTGTYATGEAKIYMPDGTIIGTLTITFTDRPNGIVQFTVTPTEANNTNAGNWIGDLELSNTGADIVEQQFFNFDILESY